MSHDYHHADGHVTRHQIRYMTRRECVDLYRTCLVTPTRELRLWDRNLQRALTVADAIAELAGHDLACWCTPWDDCHADVLLELANGGA